MGNATNSLCTEHSLPTTRLEALSSLIFYSMLGAVGLVGNVHVILVFLASASRHGERSLRFLIVVLSCTDIFICAVVLPTDCYRVYADYLASLTARQAVNHWLSALILSTRDAAFEMEAWILVLVALDRYLCIVRARRSGLSLRTTLVALAACGTCLFALESGSVIGHYLVEDKCRLKLFVETNLLRLYGALGAASVLVVLVLYIRIFTFVAGLERQRSSRRAETERTLRLMTKPLGVSHNGSNDVERQEAVDQVEAVASSPAPAVGGPSSSSSWFPRKLAVMLFAASLLFYGSMLPMILINFQLLRDSPLHRFFYLNAALNFFVYCLLNEKFRSELGRLYVRTFCGA